LLYKKGKKKQQQQQQQQQSATGLRNLKRKKRGGKY